MLTIEYVRPDELHPYEKNARKHTKKDIAAIVSSIEEFGFDDPIGVWGDNIIVEGHGRLLAAKKLGMETVPIIRLDHLTDEQRRAYALAHNRTAELSEWDLDIQAAELLDISDIDMTQFWFDESEFVKGSRFFDADKDERNSGGENEEYDEFLKKFEPKKTTDDCYTPEPVYEAVANWVAEEYGLNREQFVRPFFPGGDYQKYPYKDGEIVVDNPPFSILAEIERFYASNEIQFFLFAPALTLFNATSTSPGITCVCAGADIVYENGANVITSFVTSLEDPTVVARTAPELAARVKTAVEAIKAENRTELARNIYPDYVVTAAIMQRWSKYGVDFRVHRKDYILIDALDAQKEAGQNIYGRGLLLSERAAAERAAAERAAATQWKLSDREKAIVAKLG